MLIQKRDYCKGEKKQMKEITVKELYTLDETIAKNLFEGVTYPWEVLPKISAFILELGKTLPEEEYDKVGEDVWIAICLCTRTCDHRKERRSQTLCIYSWKCDCR